MTGQTVVSWLKKPQSKKSVLVSGLPGIGLVGKIVVDYLVKELSLKKVAEIHSDSFPASVLNKAGMIEPIVDEIYLYTNKGINYYFIAGPVQPGGDFGGSHFSDHYAFGHALVSAFKEVGVKEVYTLAGIDVSEQKLSQNPRIIVAATDAQSLKSWKNNGCLTLEGEGVISGAAAMLLLHAMREKMTGACLMAETNSRFVYGDPLAAKTLLEMVCKRFGFKVKTARLDKEIKNIESAFQKISQQIEAQNESGKENLTYVR